MQKHNGPTSIKPIDNLRAFQNEPSQEIAALEEQHRLEQVLEILLQADLAVFEELTEKHQP
jgi:hypothetical protein